MIHEIENLVRSGKLALARQKLRDLKINKIHRHEALIYANLARRLELPKLSLRILNPIVRSEQNGLQGLRSSANSNSIVAEKIEYAASLRTLGAIHEAEEILEDIDSRKYPQVNLQLAFCLISEWRYQRAIPVLRTYIENMKISDYTVLVAKTNLLDALIFEERIDEAQDLAIKLSRELDPAGHSVLYTRILELNAQIEIALGHWDLALEHLAAAKRIVEHSSDSIHTLLVAKWTAIAKSLKNGFPTDSLHEVRQRALQNKYWEMVRDCDFHIASLSADQAGLIRLYFGTPYESYRQRILRRIGSYANIPINHLWCGSMSLPPETAGASDPRHFDLLLATTADGQVKLNVGQALHRFLIALSQDFYRPMQALSLFSKLFPEEYYNPETSPNRLHHITTRFHRWAQESSLSWNLIVNDGSYRLEFKGPQGITIPRNPLPQNAKELELVRLTHLIGSEPFTSRDASSVLKVSQSSAKALLKWAVQQGKLQLKGQTHHARYKATA